MAWIIWLVGAGLIVYGVNMEYGNAAAYMVAGSITCFTVVFESVSELIKLVFNPSSGEGGT